MPKVQDLTGQQFGRLTAISETGKTVYSSQSKVWRCKCVCGKSIEVDRNSLVSGNVKSCGCLNLETSRAAGLEAIKNNYFGYVENTIICKIRSKKPQKNTKTGQKGVHLKREVRNGKTYECYQARIGFKGKRYHLGYYDNLNDAIKARKSAEEMMYEPFLEWYNDNFKVKKP